MDPETGQKMFQPQINLGITDRDECVEDALYRDAENRRMRREMVMEQTELQVLDHPPCHSPAVLTECVS